MKNFFKAFAAFFAASLCAANVFAESGGCYVRPCGEAAGIKLYTDGLLVVNGEGAAEKNGLRAGDILLAADGKKLERTEDLAEAAKNAGPGGVALTVKRGEKTKEISVIPSPGTDGPKLGLWVRDSTAGVGTVTYISADGGSYAALGHGITDVDTGTVLSVRTGNIISCSDISVRKSSKGDIGELGCAFDGENIGTLELNCENGIYGRLHTPKTDAALMRAASLEEIKEGPASILCDIDGGGAEEYSVEIKKVSHSGDADKALVIEITDEALKAKTGGILQGMSGSPIIQNGLFAGAITHVFVNDPLKGFGIAGEAMAKHTEMLF